MKNFILVSLLTLPLTAQAASLRDDATPTSFAAYVRAYSAPQLLEANATGLDARLKLLDAAPKGAHARIATFEFNNGESVRRLARHICLAAQRGVHVELLTDSKSGDRPGIDDAFDTSDDSQVVEELYQYMANCGAQIDIYNHIENYITVLGMRVPNLYGDAAHDGQSIDPLSALALVDRLLDRIGDIGNEELARSGVQTDVKPFLKSAKGLAFQLGLLVSETGKSQDDANPPFSYESTVAAVQGHYHDMLFDTAWDTIPAAKLKPALERTLKRIETDPELAPVYKNIRRFNRVQHRKLFLVENGADGCLILGGRNLGDAYLTDDAETYVDGDVLLCRNHGADASRAVDEGAASFENLKTDKSDKELGGANDLVIRPFAKDANYEFRHLVFPAALAPKGLHTGTYPGKLPAEKRTLLAERRWRDDSPILGEASLADTANWHVLRSSWDPANDEVKQTLLAQIKGESREIYLETAYAEFAPDLRAAIEAALTRGVHVRLVTNSFFVTDGMSKAIRPLMADWFERTQHRFPKLFQVQLTSYDADRMIHFKGAAFGCQAGNERAYLLGSHNFHPRSGRSDKENSFSWNEAGCDDLAHTGLVKERDDFYASLSKRLGRPVLTTYVDFHAELAAATLEDRHHPGDYASRWVAKALRSTFFLEGEHNYQIRDEARVQKVMGIAGAGGLTDLIGLLL